ncbi:DUF1304 domain-containing protein [Streptococcus hongkongensis]|nr:membrane protein [Streptococcus uberis]
MSILTIIFTIFAALEQLYIMYIETFATQSKATQRVFKLSHEALSNGTVVSLFKNQGVYNGIIGLFLLYGLFLAQTVDIVALFLINVILVAIYGALIVDYKILYKQGGFAILALISL